MQSLGTKVILLPKKKNYHIPMSMECKIPLLCVWMKNLLNTQNFANDEIYIPII